MWFLSFVGANFSFIIAGVLVLIALIAFAWFARNWRAALAAAVLLSLGFAAMAVDRSAVKRTLNEQKARELSILQGRLDTLSKVAEAYAERASEDAATIETLREQASATPANDAACLPDDAAKRIGDVK